MKRFFTTLSILSALFLFSCQKEAGFSGSNNGGGSNSGGLLKKLVSKSGSDSSVLAFGYNSSQKIITLNTTITSGGTSTLIQERAERNAQNIIQKIIIKSDQYQQAGLDSVTTVMQYSSGRYTAKVTTIDLVVFVYRDSVALIYDAAGKVITEKSYTDFGSSSYKETGKIEYTYSGNNLATIKNYTYDASSSSYSLDETYTYDQYDNKISPMFAGNEAFVFDSPFFYSSNNPTKSTYTATGNPTQNYTITYTYNTANKPVTASSNIQPGNITSTGTYYY